MKASEIAAEILERQARTRHIKPGVLSSTVRKEVNARATREPLLDAREMAQHLGICVNTLNKLAKAGLPFYTISGFTRTGKGVRRRFRVSEVEAWLRVKQESQKDMEAP